MENLTSLGYLKRKQTENIIYIDVSQLGQFNEKEIKACLKKYTKRQLLELLLSWKEMAENYKNKQ